jgi:hypothetical protein
MKYFKDLKNIVWALELNGSQDYLIEEKSLVEISDYDMKVLIDHPDTWSDERKATEKRNSMPTILPMDFDLLLDKHGLYDAVQELIKQDRSLYIAYTRAQYFSRTDPFVDQARIALKLTNEQVDKMWMS